MPRGKKGRWPMGKIALRLFLVACFFFFFGLTTWRPETEALKGRIESCVWLLHSGRLVTHFRSLCFGKVSFS
jgi:hypothetical protein